MQRLRVIVLLLLTGCASTDSADSGDTAPAVNPDAPVFTEASVGCYEHTVGDTYAQWTAEATVTDQQGADTVESMGRIAVSDARGDLGEEPLVCGSGACFGSWKDDEGVALECDTVAVGTYDFAFYATDIDGHESAPFVVHGEKTEDGA